MVQSLVVPPHLVFLCPEAADRADPSDDLQSQLFVPSLAVLDLLFQLLFDKETTRERTDAEVLFLISDVRFSATVP